MIVLPPEKDVFLILSTIKGLSLQSGIELKSFDFIPGEISTPSTNSGSLSSNVSHLPLRANFSGSWGAIKAFLNKVESVSPLMQIEKVSLSRNEENFYEANLIINTFFLNIPSTLGSIETPLPIISIEEEKIYEQLSKYEFREQTEILPEIPTGKENPFSF